MKTSTTLRNRIMLLIITLVFLIIAGAVIHAMHLTEYSGSLDENLSYDLPAGYVLQEPAADSIVEEKNYIRETDNKRETITIYYDGMYMSEEEFSSEDKTIKIDESTKVNVSVFDFDDRDNSLEYVIFHDNETYSITYKCQKLDNGKNYYSSCSKAQQDEMLAFIKTIDYHRPDGSDMNVFRRTFSNLGISGSIIFLLAVLFFVGIPLAIAIVGFRESGDGDSETTVSSRDLHESMNRERKAKGESHLPAINNVQGTSSNNLARRDHSWSSVPDFFIKLIRRK